MKAEGAAIRPRRYAMLVGKEKSNGYQVSVPMPVLQELRMRPRGVLLQVQGEPSPVPLHVQMLRQVMQQG